MIGNSPLGTRRVSMSTGSIEPSKASATWADLATADGIVTGSFSESRVPQAVRALIIDNHPPSTPDDCASIIYWCAAHDAHHVLDRLLEEWPSEVRMLKLSGNEKHIQSLRDLTEGPFNWEGDALEKTTCRVMDKLLSRGDAGLISVELEHVSFDAGDSLRLAKAIEESSSLEELYCESHCSLGDRAALLNSAAANRSLRCLRLQENLSQDEGAAAAIGKVIAGGRVKTLELKGSRFSADSAETIARALASPGCQVETLTLDNCLHRDTNPATLLDALKKCVSLRVLDMSNTPLGAARADPRHLLDFNGRLTELRLSSAGLTNACGALGRMLARNPALVSLDLSSNDLCYAGPLATSLPEKMGLRHLNLRYNDFGPDDGVHLAEWFAKCPLEKLDINFNPLKNEGVESILAAVVSNCTLSTLDLNRTGIEEVTRAIVDGLKSLRGLSHLDLRGNAMFHTGVDELFDALDHHEIELLIPGDRLSDVEILNLAQALSRNSGIKSLTISPTPHDEILALTALDSALETNHTLTQLNLELSPQPFETMPDNGVAHRRASIDSALNRNATLLRRAQGCFENFALQLHPRLPTELGLKIRGYLEGDNDGRQAIEAMRKTVRPYLDGQTT